MKEEDWYEAVFNGKELLYDDEIVVDKRELLDEDGINIFKKKSCEKTVEERIKTSRSLKIKYNKWNQVDYSDQQQQDVVVIDPSYTQHNISFEDIEFEKEFHEIIKNSKYKPILLSEDDEKIIINYQIVNDILLYTYGKLKNEYSLSRVFVMVCEYCNINLQTMWKRLSGYMKKQILEELKEFSNLPDLELNTDEIKLF